MNGFQELHEKEMSDVNGGLGPFAVGLLVIGGIALYTFIKGTIDGHKECN